MLMPDLELRLKIKIANPGDAIALIKAARLVRRASSDAPWSDDLRRAVELLRRAVSGLEARRAADHENHNVDGGGESPREDP